jgi:regulatory protein
MMPTDLPEDPAAPGRRAAVDKAVRVLAGREHTRQELTRKLARLGVQSTLAQEVVDGLANQSLQSDERFTEAFVRSRINRGYGAVWIRRALEERGVTAELIQTHLAQSPSFWVLRAREARTRKFGEALPADQKAWAREARFLAQRGFPSDAIRRVLSNRLD